MLKHHLWAVHSSVTHQFSWQAIGKQDSEVAKLKWQFNTSQNSTKQTVEGLQWMLE